MPPLPKCPYTKAGKHSLACVLPPDETGELTFYCEACGILRRVNASGSFTTGSLDDLDSDDILKNVQMNLAADEAA